MDGIHQNNVKLTLWVWINSNRYDNIYAVRRINSYHTHIKIDYRNKMRELLLSDQWWWIFSFSLSDVKDQRLTWTQILHDWFDFFFASLKLWVNKKIQLFHGTILFLRWDVNSNHSIEVLLLEVQTELSKIEHILGAHRWSR